MAEMKKEELRRNFQRLKEFIEETDLTAEILEENPAIPADSLLIGLPSDNPEEGVVRYLVMNHIPVKDEISPYTYYFHLLLEIPMEIAGLKPETVLLAINAVNAVINVGHFVYTREGDEKARVQLRYTMAVDIEEMLMGSVLYECVDFMLSSGTMMEEILAGIEAEMPLEEILMAEGIERGSFGWE